MAANTEYVDVVQPSKAADLITARIVTSFELGDSIGKPQTEVALHLSDGETLFIGADDNKLWFAKRKES